MEEKFIPRVLDIMALFYHFLKKDTNWEESETAFLYLKNCLTNISSLTQPDFKKVYMC